MDTTPTYKLFRMDTTPTYKLIRMDTTPTYKLFRLDTTPTYKLFRMDTTPTYKLFRMDTTPTCGRFSLLGSNRYIILVVSDPSLSNQLNSFVFLKSMIIALLYVKCIVKEKVYNTLYLMQFLCKYF